MIDLKNDDDECDGKHFFKYDKYAWFSWKEKQMISRKKTISYLEKRRRRCGALCAERKKILTHSTSLLPLKNYYILCKKKLTNRGFLSSKIIISCVFFCQIKINIFSSPNRCGIISWNFNFTKKNNRDSSHQFVYFRGHQNKTKWYKSNRAQHVRIYLGTSSVFDKCKANKQLIEKCKQKIAFRAKKCLNKPRLFLRWCAL